jgi:hypothetical protein
MKPIGKYCNLWCILQSFGIFLTVWYILWLLCIFYDHLVYFSHFGTKKNLATLIQGGISSEFRQVRRLLFEETVLV